jgi:hypothetical protein
VSRSGNQGNEAKGQEKADACPERRDIARQPNVEQHGGRDGGKEEAATSRKHARLFEQASFRRAEAILCGVSPGKLPPIRHASCADGPRRVGRGLAAVARIGVRAGNGSCLGHPAKMTDRL